MDTAVTYTRDIKNEMKSEKEKISICIPTYKRPKLLKKLLDSINTQILPPNVQLEIIVVDNDIERSSEQIVNEFLKDSCHSLKYFSQPKKNISLTRNMAVKEASGDYILFIDDDNYASPTLVKEHFKAIKEYDADIVFGLVKPYFNENTPKWIQDPQLYYSPMGNSGSKAKFFWTSNTIIKASVIKKYENPFDLEYGLIGGEDSYFFQQIVKEGYNLKTSREAYTLEFIPPDRTTQKYFFTRAFKGGHTFLRLQFELHKGKRLRLSVEHFFKAVVQIIFYSGKLIFVAFSKKERLRSLQKIYANFGKLVAIWGKKYQFYN